MDHLASQHSASCEGEDRRTVFNMVPTVCLPRPTLEELHMRSTPGSLPAEDLH
jgi:hypothetical protein